MSLQGEILTHVQINIYTVMTKQEEVSQIYVGFTVDVDGEYFILQVLVVKKCVLCLIGWFFNLF